MKIIHKISFLKNIIVGAAVFFLISAVQAQTAPSATVARLSYMDGTVSFSAADSNDQWVYATLNRPLVTGDHLWADTDGKAEVQIDDSAVRMGPSTSLSMLNINDKTAQFQLDQGVVNLHIKSMPQGQVYEVDTPNLAFNVNQPGDYRLDVDPNNNTTKVTVLSGEAQVSGENNSYIVDAQQSYIFSGTNLDNYQNVALASSDDFDNWVDQRNKLIDNTTSSKYVSNKIPGIQDLDKNGTWKKDKQNRDVWVPNNVPTDWAPYSQGEWQYIDPYGWTWIDDADWGYAPFHYGRWDYFDDSWAWVPGPVDAIPYFIPAIVDFLAGADGYIGWFPLGPDDFYFPPYFNNFNYFNNININNVVYNTTIINNMNNVFRNRIRPLSRNQRVRGAMTTASRSAFTQSQKINKKSGHVSPGAMSKAKVTNNPHIKPTAASKRGGSKAAKSLPPKTAHKPVLAKNKPGKRNANVKMVKPSKAVHPEAKKEAPAAHEKGVSHGMVPHPPTHPNLHPAKHLQPTHPAKQLQPGKTRATPTHPMKALQPTKHLQPTKANAPQKKVQPKRTQPAQHVQQRKTQPQRHAQPVKRVQQHKAQPQRHVQPASHVQQHRAQPQRRAQPVSHVQQRRAQPQYHRAQQYQQRRAQPQQRRAQPMQQQRRVRH